MQTGQCVELRFATTDAKRGTVSRVTHTQFRVSYDSIRDDKGHVTPGGRYWYPLTSARFFKVVGA